MSNIANTQEDYDALRRLHNSMVLALEDLQKENTALQGEVALLNAKLVNAQRAVDINKEIVRNALTLQNKIQTEYGQEIQELRAKVKALGG